MSDMDGQGLLRALLAYYATESHSRHAPPQGADLLIHAWQLVYGLPDTDEGREAAVERVGEELEDISINLFG